MTDIPLTRKYVSGFLDNFKLYWGEKKQESKGDVIEQLCF